MIITHSGPIYMVTGPTDMRKGQKALEKVVYRYHQSPDHRAMYVFINVLSNRIKILTWGIGRELRYIPLEPHEEFNWAPPMACGIIPMTLAKLRQIVSNASYVNPDGRW